MSILSVILVFVRIIINSSFSQPWVNVNLLEGQVLECIWTLIPALILVLIACPSLSILYQLEEYFLTQDALRLKTIGHQWYWSYEYRDFWFQESDKIEFDSYIVPHIDESCLFRLLEVDNRVVMPLNIRARVLVSSADVLHSWTVPSMGVKVDACPGRLNEVVVTPQNLGVFYGQCSEICGANHRFMPICLEVIQPIDFLNWVIQSV